MKSSLFLSATPRPTGPAVPSPGERLGEGSMRCAPGKCLKPQGFYRAEQPFLRCLWSEDIGGAAAVGLLLPGHAQPAPACPQPQGRHGFCTISTSFPVIPGTLLFRLKHRLQQSSKRLLPSPGQNQPGIFNWGKAGQGKPKGSDFPTQF